MTSSAPAETAKSLLRTSVLAHRDALPAEMRAQGAQTVAARGLPVPVAKGAVVSGFMPMKSEINPLPLMKRLGEAGAQLALPVVMGRGKPLTMRGWTYGAPLESGVWGIKQPGVDAPEVFPDILLVPLAAFDRSGHRIGYGAGYYDMTIARLKAMKPVVTLGLAFAAQEIPAVPDEAWDVPLDFILTEQDVIACGRA
jgi:5-formyltetrahydrofolate cyclo-ligase